jgi:hypothetical protein
MPQPRSGHKTMRTSLSYAGEFRCMVFHDEQSGS